MPTTTSRPAQFRAVDLHPAARRGSPHLASGTITLPQLVLRAFFASTLQTRGLISVDPLLSFAMNFAASCESGTHEQNTSSVQQEGLHNNVALKHSDRPIQQRRTREKLGMNLKRTSHRELPRGELKLSDALGRLPINGNSTKARGPAG